MIAIMNERANRNRLLAAILVFAMAVCVLTAIIPAAETDAADGGYEEIAPDDFLKLEKNDVITLDKSYNVTGTVTVSSNLKVVMNHNSLTTSGDLFKLGADDVTLEIVGDEDSSITAGQTGQASVVWGNHKTGTLVVTGGTYSADYALVWCGTGENGTVTIQDATINGVTTGTWISYESNKSLTIDNCTITAAGTGIYCATAVKASITNTDVTVVGGGTALEIKAGTVTVEDSSFVSDGFEMTNGQINTNGSGAGVATISINNGYTDTAGVEGVDVTITDCVVENSASETPVQIAVGDISDKAATGNIEFSSNCVTPTQIALYYSALSQADEPRTITVEYTGTQDTPEIENITGAITSAQAGSGNILVVTTSINDDTTKSLTNGTTLIVSGGATYSGDISIDSEGAVSINGGTFTGTVTTPANGDSTNTAVLDGVSGSIRITQGSIAIEGDFDAGTMTVTGEATLTGDVTIGDGARLTLNEGTTLNLNGYTLTVESGGAIAGSGTIDVTSGTFESAGGTTTVTFAHNRNTMLMEDVKGTYTLQRGSVAIAGEGVTFESGKITISGQAKLLADVTVSGVTIIINKGATLTTGAFKLDVSAATSVTNNGTIVVSDKGELVVGAGFTNEEAITVYGKVTGTGATNNGTITVLDNGKVETTFSGTGSVDMSGVSSDGTLGGTYGTSINADAVLEYPADQNITLDSNTILVNDITMKFYGTLVIPEGMTLTISNTALLALDGQSATIVNNGTIVIQATDDGNGLAVSNGAKVQNNGTIVIQYTPTSDTDEKAPNTLIIGATVNGLTNVASADVDDTGSAIINNGSISVGEQTTVTLCGFIQNNAGAAIDIDGKIISNAPAFIKNAGTVNVNATVTGQLKISNSDIGATTSIEALNGTVYVDDAGITSKDYVAATNTVSVYGGADHTIGGIVITSATYDMGTGNDAKTYKTLDVSGAVSVAYTAELAAGHIHTAEETSIRFVGDITISGDFSIAEGNTLKFGKVGSESTRITVSGNMTVPRGAVAVSAYATTEIVVSGLITSSVEFNDAEMDLNAASYSVESEITENNSTTKFTTYYYTTLENAIDSGSKAITVYGEIEVSADITIPADVVVTQDDGSKITVGENATVTVEDKGAIANGNVAVDGTLYVANASTGFKDGVAVSEVYSSNGTDARYTNLRTAMAAAQSGDTVTLNNAEGCEGVTLELTSFTIKDGVTLDTNGMAFKVIGTTLTIDGTLLITDVTKYEFKDADNGVESSIVLNGYIKSQDNMAFDDGKFPAGAYYSVDENGTTYNYITTVANAAQVIDDVDSDTVRIHGAVSVGEVAFASEAADGAYVYVESDATVTGTISIDNVTLTVNGKVAGSVTDAAKSGTFTTDSNATYGNV